MRTSTLILLIVIAVIVLGWPLWKRAFSVIRGWFAEGLDRVEKIDPTVMYRQKITEGEQSLEAAKRSLAETRSLQKQQERLASVLEADLAEHERQIKFAMSNGREQDAQRLARVHVEIEKRLDGARKQATSIGELYEKHKQTVREAEERLVRARAQAASLSNELKLAKSRAEINQRLKQSSALSEIDETAKYEEEVRRQIDEANAKADVSELGNEFKADYQSSENQRAAEDLLAKFRPGAKAETKIDGLAQDSKPGSNGPAAPSPA